MKLENVKIYITICIIKPHMLISNYNQAIIKGNHYISNFKSMYCWIDVQLD